MEKRRGGGRQPTDQRRQNPTLPVVSLMLSWLGVVEVRVLPGNKLTAFNDLK